jgi:hypothetical protein
VSGSVYASKTESIADMMDHSTLTYRLGVMDDWESSVTLSKISFASNYFYDFGMVGPPYDINLCIM